MFIAKLHSYGDISRKRILTILNDELESRKKYLNNLNESILNNKNIDIEERKKLSRKILEDLQLYGKLDTEYNIFKEFVKQKTFVMPESKQIGEREDYRRKDGVKRLVFVSVTAQFIKMRDVLKLFFELPNVYDKTSVYVNALHHKDPVISNFIQGKLWQTLKKPFVNKEVYPLFLHFDDYEPNNPLGTHRVVNGCGAVYSQIPCLPPEFQSKLKYIFLFTLFNTLDRSFFKNKVVLSKIIDELQYLETNGIGINVGKKKKQLHFKLSLILGDNKGLNELLGFVSSFRGDYFCRFCEIQRDEMQNTYTESNCKMRK